jgi:hypothetical protein
MITLSFLICMANGQCITTGPDTILRTMVQCETVANAILAETDRRMAAGEIEPHVAKYKCVDWGVPS